MENQNTRPVIATVTEEERQAFLNIQDGMRAQEQAAQQIIEQTAAFIAKQKRELLMAHRVLWEAAERKYGLDPHKHYEIRTTGEIVEHVCQPHIGAMVAVDIGEVLRRAARGTPTPPDPSKAN